MIDAKAKILVVDDLTSNIEMLDQVLGEEYEILVALNGPEALRTALADTPDLILLDVVMPGMTGLEVCVYLKKDPRTADIPIIFITSLNQEMDEELGLSLGAIDFISKPFSPPVVRARVKNHIKLKRQGDMLRGFSFLDGLTGVANRRRFDLFLDQEWRRGIRSGTPLSLIMMDIDYFKAYNDAAGHLAGDHCLRKLGQGLADIVQRPGDLVARYGGEEFIYILSETKASGAQKVALRIQAMVAELALPHPGSAVSPLVTLSMGLATAVPAGENEADSIIHAADQALYTAKAGGRNRIA